MSRRTQIIWLASLVFIVGCIALGFLAQKINDERNARDISMMMHRFDVASGQSHTNETAGVTNN
jgi:preprotein translocase subunit SecG